MTDNIKVIDKNYRNNDDRIAQEEAELEELKKKHKEEVEGKKGPEQEEEKPNTEETQEEDDKGNFKKRYGDLRRHLAKKQEEWEAEKTELTDRLKKLEENSNNPPSEVKVPKTKKEFMAWKEKYSDVAGFIEEIAKEKAEEMFQNAEERLQQYEEVTSELSKAQAMSKVRKAHKDWDEVVEDSDFHDWVEEQPDFLNYSYYIYDQHDNTDAIIHVVNEYKRATGKTIEDTKKKEKEAATSTGRSSSKPEVETKDKSVIKESEIASMRPEEYERHKDDIASGKYKIEYDLSGGAR